MLHDRTAQVNAELATHSHLGHSGATFYSATLLPTATVLTKSKGNGKIPVRALLDSGSQITCITESCRKRLGIPSRRADTQITGIGGNFSTTSSSIVQLQLVPPYDSVIETAAVVLDRGQIFYPHTPSESPTWTVSRIFNGQTQT